jgi:SpoVK/Ycf46/Vps4 family AAA+-type ATPase
VGINKSLKKSECDLLNIVVTGIPGSGKTTFIEILANIFKSLGVLKYGHIVKVKRSDLIGKYLGHTAAQTQKKIDEAYGGILLIDEAYSLGNAEGRDSFSKECLDTLNQALYEDKGKFICIIAGYKDALDNSFFNYNEGLKRRFPFRFEIEKYSYNELGNILLKKINENSNWILDCNNNEIIEIIKKNFDYFENQGGDMETLFLNIKIVQNKRVFLLPIDQKKKIILDDINNAIKKFILLKCIKDDKLNPSLYGMYC